MQRDSAPVRTDFAAWVGKHQGELEGFTALLCAEQPGWRGLLVDVLAHAYLRWDRICMQAPDEIETTLYRMLVRRHRRPWPRLREHHTIHRADHTTPPAGDLRAAAMRLPQRQREVVALRYYTRMDLTRTAQVLRYRPETVEELSHAALTHLATTPHGARPPRKASA